jgi:Ala-tRNA(Pro) deacylase
MTMPTAVRDWLSHVHVPYTPLAHRPAFTAQEEAEATHVSGRDWAKTVVCFADEEPIFAVLPSPLIINCEKLRTLIGARRIRLASEEEMARLYPDCEVGATPPLGPLYKQHVFVDRRLAQESEIVFNAGTHTDAIRTPYKAFAAIAHPIVGEFGDLPTKTETSTVRDGQALWI